MMDLSGSLPSFMKEGQAPGRKGRQDKKESSFQKGKSSLLGYRPLFWCFRDRKALAGACPAGGSFQIPDVAVALDHNVGAADVLMKQQVMAEIFELQGLGRKVEAGLDHDLLLIDLHDVRVL